MFRYALALIGLAEVTISRAQKVDNQDYTQRECRLGPVACVRAR
jgi:hypothetical protein